MKAIRIEQHGGADVLRVADLATPEPGLGEVRVRHEAIGVNFIDTYHRSGLYPNALPHGLGLEGAGIVDSSRERHALQARRSHRVMQRADRRLRGAACRAEARAVAIPGASAPRSRRRQCSRA